MSATVARRYFGRGRDALKRGDLDDAVNDFRAAIDLVPEFCEARAAYALVLARTDAARAAQSLRAGLTRATRPADRRQLLMALGEVLLAGADYAGADAALSEAEALGGTSRRIEDRRARVAAKLGDYATAFDRMLAASQR